MRRMLQECAVLFGLLVCVMDPNSASAQAVQQSSTVTPGHAVRWVTNGVVGDGGTASNPLLSSIGTAGSGPTICASSATTGALNRICLSATATSGGITMNNIGGGTGGFTFTLNGVVQGIATVTLPVTTNDGACFADSTGTLRDCGGAPIVIVTPCSNAGDFPVFSGIVYQCSTGAAVSPKVANATNGIILNGQVPTTGYLVDIHAGFGTPLAMSTGGSVTSTKSFIDTGTGTGKVFYGLDSELHLSTGTGGGAIGIQGYAVAEGTWTYSGTNFEGPIGIFGWGQSSRGGWVWGGNFQAICTTITAASCVGAEIDVGNSINGTATKVGLQVVSVAGDTGTISTPAQSYGYALLLQPGGSGFHSGLYFGSGVATNRLIYSAGGSLTTGVDISAASISGNAWASAGTGASPGVAITGLGVIRLNQNAVAAPADITGTILHITGADSSPTLIAIDGFAVAPTFNGRRANGTNASPTGLIANDIMVAFSGRGYTSAGAYTTARGITQVVATETWSGTNQGARLDFVTTPTGSITPVTGMSLLSGTLTLGVSTSVAGSVALFGSSSGTSTIVTQAAAGTPTLTLPNASGTFAISATSPLSLSATTGALTCSTCATTAGANIPSLATGDILYASAANVLSALADVAVLNVLISGGVGVAPSWGKVALGALATQATNTVLANATSGTVVPTALSVGSCSTSSSALIWTTNTGFGCNTSINAATLGGATFAAPGAIGGGTPSTGAFTTLTASTSVTSPIHYGGSAAGSTNTIRSTSGTGTTDAIIFGVGTDGGTESFRVVTGGQLVKGGTVAQSVVANTAAFQIQGSNLGASSLLNGRWQSANANGPANYFLKSRNSTPGSFSIIQSGDTLGSIFWAGDDGSTYNSVAASISVLVDGTPGVGDMPGRMLLSTTLDGSAGSLVRIVIGNDGGVNIGPTQGNVGAGILNVEATTASTSKLTGSLINKGGFGNAGAVFTDTLNIITVANASTTAALCWNSGTGLVTENGAVGTCTVSDGRLKNVVGPIKGALDKLLQIHGVYFTWKDQPRFGVGMQAGVIAQDVEKVFPELVSTDGEGKLSADYQRLTAPIIEALRELKADNDNLRAEVMKQRRAK